MGTTAAIISAAAASVAAFLTAINLVVSGRRDHAKWARNTLIEVLVDFLDASFESKDAVERAIREGEPESWSTASQASRREEAKVAQRRMRVMQSRLRLLAPPDVMDAAHRLRIETNRYLALLDGPLDTARERELGMRRDLWVPRQEFLNQAKRALALPRPWRRIPKTQPWEALDLPSDSERRTASRPPVIDQLGDNHQ
jgi:hypothetical protein